MIKFSIISVAMGIAGMWLCATSCQEGEKMDEPEYQADASQVRTSVVTSTEAMDVAAAFSTGRFGKAGKPTSRSMQSVETINGASGEPVAYVVNTDGAGWVIVSATKDYHPILAYSDDAKSTFHLDGSEQNTGVAVWMDEVSTAIAESSSLDSLTTAAIAMEWAEYSPKTQSTIGGTGLPGGNSEEAVKCRERLKVLNETYYQEGWSFTTLPNVTEAVLPSSVYTIADWCGSPYEYTIVGIKDVSQRTNVQPLLTTHWNQHDEFNALCPNKAAAGCAAIAMAQIMRYHEWPNNFNWDNMDDYLATVASQRLISQVGRMINTDYGDKEDEKSGANINDVRNGFINYGYSAEIKDHDSFDVVREIGTYKRPVYMRGLEKWPSTKGHAWVCDGVIRNFAEYQYYVEYINSVKEYVNYGETLMENPGMCGGTSYTRYHMNWGFRKIKDNNGNLIQPDGWYIDATPGNRDYTRSRQNMYVSPNK